MSDRQRFTIGYHLNTWDLAGHPLGEGLDLLDRSGIRWYEALARDGLSEDFVRRHMRVGPAEPSRPVLDRDLLARVGLFSAAQRGGRVRAAALYLNAELISPPLWPLERATAEAVMRIVVGLGGRGLVVGGGPPAAAGEAGPDIDLLCERLEELGATAGELGLWLAYHPHLDTLVETPDQLERLMSGLDTERCGLCVDPAHVAAGGGDPVTVVREHGPAIRHVHLKDTRLTRGARAGERYADFCELGRGAIDLPGFARALADCSFDGLAIIELDGSDNPEASVRESLAYVRERLGLALEPA